MNDMLNFVQERGQVASFFVVVVALALAASPLARLLQLPRGRVTDLFWNGGIAFAVAGRLWYLAAESPRSITDPIVAIRVQDGIEPLAGVAGVVLALAWQLRIERREARARLRDRRRSDARSSSRFWPLLSWPPTSWSWAAAAVAGIAITTVAYDLACPLRDACYGITAPPPLGFRMSGLADERIATPLIEAATLLLALALLVSRWPRLRAGVAALLGLATLALLRLALTPLAVGGGRGWDVELTLLALVGLAALASALRLQTRQPDDPAAPNAEAEAAP